MKNDAAFAWRRLQKSKVTSAAAILSLALALGASTAAFRLIDALLLRPLPISHPERLYALTRPELDGWEYGQFTRMRDAVPNRATVLALSFAEHVDLTYGSDDAMEKGDVQYVSGSMFTSFGMVPAVGRLLTEDDNQPVAVISHDYWTRRFGRDPEVLGHTFRIADKIYEIVGIANEGFTGTEPGTVIDIFLPATMHWGVGHEWAVFRVFAQLNDGVAAGAVHDQLDATVHLFYEERHQRPQPLIMHSAAAGASGLQKNYRLSLWAIGVLVAMVLLIACANIANLMTAQAAARAREMALRVSLGASRWRLARLVLAESVWIAGLAAALGAIFAWWAAPFVVRMVSPADHPVRLFLNSNWRVFAFGLALTAAVAVLLGLVPALRASAVNPIDALKGNAGRGLRAMLPMRLSIAVQAAFCFLVLFVAGLFVATFERLSHQPTGISPQKILTLYTVTRQDQPQALWSQVAEHLRGVAGVEKVAIADWPILDGWGYRASSISVDGAEPLGGGWFLNISPGMLEVMKMPLLDGRDFTEGDTSVAIVNSAFARRYFQGENPVGKWFAGSPTNGGPRRFQIVGLVRDARYRYLREGFLSVAYIPYRRIDAKGELQGSDRGTFIVRTVSENPLSMASILREEISKSRPEFRVSNIRTQTELIESQTIRERLLAMLAMFFASVALLLAGIGLYGVLNYSVIQRRKEIGIRMAIGARGGRIARLVTMDMVTMVVLGAGVGLGMGLAAARFIQTLLFEVKATGLPALTIPALLIFIAAFLAALPAVVHAVRIDPMETLREE